MCRRTDRAELACGTNAADSFADCVWNVVLDGVAVSVVGDLGVSLVGDLGVKGGVGVGVTIEMVDRDDEEPVCSIVGTVVKLGTIAIELVDAV